MSSMRKKLVEMGFKIHEKTVKIVLKMHDGVFLIQNVICVLVHIQTIQANFVMEIFLNEFFGINKK
jgi:hypothetical protein